ncbi:MAG: polysaccharide biosynthesis C-terminal domain-containing protein [Methylococcaceae bacterium]|nr:polysaccharide biosynthesis C-terminal domain-containing protein [Methylococcaceae bacterium]
MNPLRKLASQTVVYGLSSIIGRFLNYLLVPLYTYTFAASDYGIVSEFYAYAGFFAVVLVFGLETGYFRFRNRDGIPPGAAYPAALSVVLLANLAFVTGIVIFRQPLADILRYPEHPEYLIWFGLILAMDAVSALPFARLRAEDRAWRFAGIKIAEILVAIGLNLLFLLGWPKAAALWPDSAMARLYDPAIGVGFIFLANLIASVCKMLLLLPQLRGFRFRDGLRVIRPLLAYSLPMVVIGFAGVINEMLDRAILKYLLPYDLKENLRILGIYGACYKLSILMTLFVQAFRYAGEPFFFAYAGRDDARQAYALVLKYFVIFCVFIFLLVTLFLDVFKYFVGAEYREGLDVVPILLMANLFLGVYVNLSVWYKLTDRTGMGAWVSLAAALVTIGLNFWWIPIIGYRGSAWAHLASYGGMAMVSYLLGRHYYPIPYPVFRLTAYLALGLGLYFADRELVDYCGWSALKTGAALMGVYLLVVALADVRPLLRRRRQPLTSPPSPE